MLLAPQFIILLTLATVILIFGVTMDLTSFVSLHGQKAAAVALNASQSAISQWLNGTMKISAERALDMENRTGGAMTRAELRPDLFGPTPPAQAQEQAA